MTADDAQSTRSFGFTDVPAEEKQGRVDAVFSKVAKRYDVMNDVMSFGVHRIWKDLFVAKLPRLAGPRAFTLLDVAGGTGDIAFRALKGAGPNVRAIVCDISGPMLREGARRAEARDLGGRIDFVQGNAEALPVPRGSIDAYTIAYGIRNVPDIPKALREAHAALKPGGRFLCLEFSQVDVPGFDKVYDAFSFNVIPRMGQVIAGDADSYRYLVESIRRFPDQEAFADMIRDAGFSRVSYTNLSGGITAIHSGWKL
ncbi:MAG: bifunctional demethylmenaquinone methyltransferase/2-methoxy-6-polyprenyl-1,4-benzoquinol methylase UbiE [Pseudomonadota bacterium]